MIDLRSDTVTRPSAAMRRLVVDAEVGDAALDGDPTTRRLEQQDVRVSLLGSRRLHAVTHVDVSRADVTRAADVVARVLTG